MCLCLLPFKYKLIKTGKDLLLLIYLTADTFKDKIATMVAVLDEIISFRLNMQIGLNSEIKNRT